MNPQFYVARPGDSQRQGPFTREQLEQGLHGGQFAPGDLAWQTGTAEWIPLSTLLMPALPEMPPLPEGMPPLPPPPPPVSASAYGAVPPPPPFDHSSGHAVPPPPPYPGYAGAYRAPWSPVGLLGFIVALAGIGAGAWFLFELWEKYPATKAPMLDEETIGWIIAGFGGVALLLAIIQLCMKRRGRGWGVAALIFGILLAGGGVAAAGFASSWAKFRYDDEEASARRDLSSLGRYALEYAKAHGGRFPNSLEELRKGSREADLQMSYTFDRGSTARTVRVTPGLTIHSPENTVLLSDTWSSGRGNRAVYRVGGEVISQSMWITTGGETGDDAKTPVQPVAPVAPVVEPTPGPLAPYTPPVAPAFDLSTPEKCIATLVAAGRRGDMATVRRCMTLQGFNKEFAGSTPAQMKEEFGNMGFRVKSVGQPTVDYTGQMRVQVVLTITEEGQSNDDTATFLRQGSEWLLESI